jgi:myo-inositol-1(or 4)-monophosphatase
VAFDPETLLDLATSTAREAGALLRDRPEHLVADAKSSPTDAVTVMDRAAERLILERLMAARPDDGVVAEEGGSHAGTSDVRWYVDPLDGTVNYLYALPQYAVSIAAEAAGEMVAGAVYDVVKDELFAATAGGGATLNGRAIRCTSQSDPAMSLVATGFSYAAETRAAQARVLTHVLPRVRDIRRLGSAALDLCALAAGRVDAYFEAELHPWDWAAASLIAGEAGARVAGLGGHPPGQGVTLAANPSLFTQMEDLLVEAGAADPPS